MRALYCAAYPGIAGRFLTIENGVDLDEPWRREPASVSRERFEIRYVGCFDRLTSPLAFLRGLSRARDLSRDFARRARFQVVGAMGFTREIAEANRRAVIDLGIGELVEERGYVPHAQAVRAQRSAGALMFTVADAPLVACGKSYEYLAAGRPIIAVASPEGEAASVLRHSPHVAFAAPGDPQDIAEKILGLFARWERGELFALPSADVPERYVRANQVRRLAEALIAVVAEAKDGTAR
jgi:glycosyltransferase involved in cell wall biosynthesis